MSKRAASRYTIVAVTLHWVIAALIIGLIFLGWNMHGNEQLYQLHKSLGISVLLLTVARIVWRVMNPAPPLPEDMENWQKTISHVTHWAFYALMILMPLTGWLYVSTSYDFDVPTVLFGVVSWPDIPFVGFLTNETGNTALENVHGKLAWLALGLVGLHVAGAVKHEFGDEEGVLKRMVPKLFGTADAPEQPSRGAIAAFGSAFAVFAVVAAIPIVLSSGGGNIAIADAGNPNLEPNWSVDYGASSIVFSGVHDGSRYEGEFQNWVAEISFDPVAPDAGQALVSVATGSAQANQKLYTDSLKSAEWFGVAEFPTAEARISDISFDGGAYNSTLTLDLKAAKISTPFPFTLEFEGDTARMSAQLTLSRAALDLGMVSDPGADWVDDEVTVDVAVTASRLR